jgi:hypothetical protein
MHVVITGPDQKQIAPLRPSSQFRMTTNQMLDTSLAEGLKQAPMVST